MVHISGGNGHAVHRLSTPLVEHSAAHHAEQVNELLRIRLTAHCGVALTRDLSDCGYGRHGVSALVRAGHLVRVRAGAFVEGARHRDSDAVHRHLLEARAVALSLGRSYALSHLSAVATLGLPVVTATSARCTSATWARASPGKISGSTPIHPSPLLTWLFTAGCSL